MSVDLTKFRDPLQNAWKDVLNDKTPTDWALFGYEKMTNSLQVVGTGDGGIEELVDELNSGKIMYAFCRVVDPKTSLNKFVFINWQGEGAPIARKGVCAGHVKDVINMIKGAHITINARTEDDVEPNTILEQVANASSSQFNFKERSDLSAENVAPVGSVYKRIQPTKEINPSEREKFWEKEQAEEKQRVVEEKKKADAERKKLETERKERERQETVLRDEAVKQRARSIKQVKEMQKISEQKERMKEQEKLLWEKQLQEDAQDEKERRVRSEGLRRERSHEAQNIISQRTINARAIFERNTAAGQLSSIQGAPKQSKIIQNFESEPNEEPQEEKKEVVPEIQKRFREPRLERCSHMELSPSPRDLNKHFHFSRNPTEESTSPEHKPNEEQNGGEPLNLETKKPESNEPSNVVLDDEPVINYQDDVQETSNPADGLRARALYDYQAADETEISFDPDDIITQIEQIDEGWWQGQGPDGTYGLFPANYVELLD